MSTRGDRYRAATCLIIGALLLGACSALPTDPGAEVTPLTPLPRPVATLTPAVAAERGDILARRDLLPTVEAAIAEHAGLAVRADYRSANGLTGAPTEVAGAFFVPKGSPPPGGWPIIALAHATTGIVHGCGLSSSADLRGLAGAVGSLLSAGYAVAVTDYAGLDDVGEHLYLEPRSAAFNVIDSVRALRKMSSTSGDAWVGLGISQGGQAVWAAAEQNAQYGAGLRMLGAAALAPAADISPVADLAATGTLSATQVALMPMVVTGLARTYGLDSRTTLRGAATAPNALDCDRAADRARNAVRSVDVRPVTDGDVSRLRDLLRANALPQEPSAVPLLVVYGGDDDVVRPAWTRAAVARACVLGTPVSARELPRAGHADVVPDAQVMTWIADRFAGRAVSGACGEAQR